ncbi:hypothetical protein KJ707_02600 [Patescibacteria group bacterium]|nr:hypothetical protein [Patescibacteria group bacterium]MBU1967005.1 hypothetical protein [Patescibacteria group bacterium]MBU2543427.1 hypothetical protein [Patescibacteria group bacterium]
MLNLKNLKKSLLKKITLIDLVLILFGILIVGFLLFYFRRQRVFIYIDLTFQRQDWNVNSFPPEYWEVNKLRVGDVGYNSVGKKVVEIQEIEKNVWDGGRRLYVEMVVKLDAVYNTTTRTYVYDGNPLLVGEELNLKFNDTSFTGIVVNVYKNPEQRFADYRRANAEIKVHYRDYDPWHAEAIKNFVVTNSKGEIILKTKEVKITPAEKVVVNDRGDVLLRWDPIKKDITATFELPDVLCVDKLCYYNHYQTFMIGEAFWADSGQTYVRDGSVMSSTINYTE